MSSKLKKRGFKVHDDELTRQLYATDGSIYQLKPQGVFFPRSIQETSEFLKASLEENLSITPRGAGTGLVGGAIGEGMVVDFARHNKQIRAFDPERKIVRVDPGVVLDQLNRFLRPHGYMFGPDVATSSRATIGGMIGNNSSGARVPRYGTTSDHLQSLTGVTRAGTLIQTQPESGSLSEKASLIGQLVKQNDEELERIRNSDIIKRWPGYALHSWPSEGTNWPALLAGSEGTLVGVVEAELKVVPLPKEKGLGLVHFGSISDAMQASVSLQSLEPSAVEHIDRILLDQTRGQLNFQAARDFLDLDQRPSESILIVEFDSEIHDRLNQLSKLSLGTRTQTVVNPDEMDLVWSLRKAGLSLLTGCPGAAKPTTGIEDAALPPHQLPDYVQALQKLLATLDLEACFYGHAASGLLHVRPVIDTHSAADLKRFRTVALEVSSLVKEFKGSLAAEHGVGIARAEFMPAHIEPKLWQAMKTIKGEFDPDNLMNPGKIFGGPEIAIDQNLRTRLREDANLPFSPQLQYAAKDHSFSAHLDQCNGCGGCRKQSGTMCPTYMATGEESMSTRGRANLIRAALDHRSDASKSPLQSFELDHALSNCLACRACATECPSNVNLALLKAELLNARYQETGIPLLARIISEADTIGRLGTQFPTLSNFLLRSNWVQSLLDTQLGLTDQRPLPPFAAQRFDRWFRDRAPSHARNETPKVILWDDTFTRYYDPQIGRSAVLLLEKLGYTVHVVKDRACCGRPALSQGNIPRAREFAQHNIDALDRDSIEPPILFLEPSCYSMFAEDYQELGIAGADDISKRCILIEDFLQRDCAAQLHRLTTPSEQPVAVHLHCHAKALIHKNPLLAAILQSFPNTTFLDEGCCGMAGAFGSLSEKYELSRRIAAPLVTQVKGLPADTIVLSSGTSCRQQLSHLTERPVKHPIELLFSRFSETMKANSPLNSDLP